MSQLNSERSNPWTIYGGGSDPSPSQTGADSGAPWKNYGTSSIKAISYGFVATAILISMFLIMAIFEHLFKPNAASSSAPQHGSNRPSELRSLQKLGHQKMVTTACASLDFSVLMPGQHYPTRIAQPAPLPCPREGARWPSHEQNFSLHRV